MDDWFPLLAHPNGPHSLTSAGLSYVWNSPCAAAGGWRTRRRRLAPNLARRDGGTYARSFLLLTADLTEVRRYSTS